MFDDNMVHALFIAGAQTRHQEMERWRRCGFLIGETMGVLACARIGHVLRTLENRLPRFVVMDVRHV